MIEKFVLINPQVFVYAWLSILDLIPNFGIFLEERLQQLVGMINAARAAHLANTVHAQLGSTNVDGVNAKTSSSDRADC